MKFIEDKEIILNKDNDLLSTNNYAETLKYSIDSIPEECEKSFTIGLFGEWGSGKSSIIKTTQELYKKGAGNINVKFIIYDSWKYANDSFRRMFLLKIQETLRFEKTELMNSFYLNENADVRITRKLNKTFLIIFILFYLTLTAIICSLDVKVDYKITGVLLLSFLGFIASFFKKAFDEFKVNIQKPHFFAPEQFEACFCEMISKSMKKKRAWKETFERWVKGERYEKNIDRMVIVIDNIDRCHNSQAYELLTNIKNFLGYHKGVVFVIPVDDGALKRHVMYCNGEDTAQEAEEFLRKFFNVVIRMKPLKVYDLYSYAKKMNDKYEYKFSNETLDIIGKEYASNPRRIIQLFNNLKLEINNKDYDDINQALVCKFLIIREEWEEYFKYIARNPYLLNNPDEKIREIINKYPVLEAFLKKTAALTKNTPIHVMGKILQNSDAFSRMPEDVIEAINNLNFSSLSSFIDNDNIKDTIIDYCIEKLKEYLESSRTNSALNILETIFFLGHKKLLNRSHNLKIQSILEPDYIKSFDFQNLNDPSLLVEYSEKLAENGYNYLKQYIVNTVNSISTDLDENKQTNKKIDGELLRNMIQVYEDDDSLKRLGEAFYLDYKQNNMEFDNYGAPPEHFKPLITEKLFSFVLGKVKSISDDIIDDWVFLIKYKLVDDLKTDQIIIKILEIHPTFNTKDCNEVDKAIKELNYLFGSVENSFLENNFQNLQTLFDIIRTRKIETKNNYNRGQEEEVNFADEISDDTEKVENYVNFLYNTYRVTSEKIPIYQELVTLWNNDGNRQIIKKYLIKLMKSGFTLSPLINLIYDDKLYDENQLKLIEHTWTKKLNNEYILPDKKLSEVVSELLNVAVDNQLQREFLEGHIHESRIREILTQIIVRKTKDEILKLPASLQKLAFDNVCSGDTIFEYKDDIDFLCAIAANGTKANIKSLAKVIINLLLEENSRKNGILIINNLSQISKRDANPIISTLESSLSDTENDDCSLREVISKLKKLAQ